MPLGYHNGQIAHVECDRCAIGYNVPGPRPLNFKMKRTGRGVVAVFCQLCAPDGFLGGPKKRGK